MKYLQIKLEEKEAKELNNFAKKTERTFSKAGRYLLVQSIEKLKDD